VPPADVSTHTLKLAAKSLPQNNSLLLVLNLSHDGLKAEHVELLAQTLDANKTLTELDLRGNELGNKGFVELARVLQHSFLPGRPVRLDRLWLGKNAAGVAGAAHMLRVSELKH
jgi:hypothetical protein